MHLALGIMATVLAAAVIYGVAFFLFGWRPKNRKLRLTIGWTLGALVIAVAVLAIWGSVNPQPLPSHGNSHQEVDTYRPIVTTTTVAPQVLVPNVTGDSVDGAESALSAAAIPYQVDQVANFCSGVLTPAGPTELTHGVRSQDPGPGAMIPVGAVVTLEVC